jgi:hypothetical protein
MTINIYCVYTPFFSEHSLVAYTCIYALYTPIQFIMVLSTEALSHRKAACARNLGICFSSAIQLLCSLGTF